jgi:hypothetical protein
MSLFDVFLFELLVYTREAKKLSLVIILVKKLAYRGHPDCRNGWRKYILEFRHFRVYLKQLAGVEFLQFHFLKFSENAGSISVLVCVSLSLSLSLSQYSYRCVRVCVSILNNYTPSAVSTKMSSGRPTEG